MAAIRAHGALLHGAHRAIFPLLHRHSPKLTARRIKQPQDAAPGFDSGKKFKRLDGHERPDDPGHRAKYAIAGTIFERFVGFLI